MCWLLLKVRDSRVLVLTAVVIFSLAAVVDAQSRGPRRPAVKSAFHVGQKVEFEFLGEVCSGEVTEILGTGWVKVSFQSDDRQKDWIFPPDQVWLPKKPAAAAKPADQPKAPIRTWADSTGQFKLDARFVALQDGKLTVEKADGSRKTLPLDKLSDEDQKAAQKFAAKTPAANPFEGSDDAQSPAAAKTEPLNDEEIVAPEGDWSSVRQVMVDISSKGRFEPDAAGGEPLPQMHAVMLDLTKGAKDRNFAREKAAGLFYDRSRQRLIVASTNDDLQGGRRGARLEACDLKSGNSLGAVVLETGIVPCDMSPDGSSVVCLPTKLVSAFHKQRGIEVWRMQAGGKLARRWNPNGTRGKDEMLQVDHAMFISRDLLLTDSGMGGKLIVWDVDHARAVYTLSVDLNSQPALSANRKQFAASSSGVVCVFDAQTGQTLLALTNDEGAPAGRAAARVRRGSRIATHLAFRPDGCQLATLGDGVLRIWDLQKQALVQQIWLPQTSPRFESDALEWIDNNYVLVNGADLVDLARQVVLWHYDVPGSTRSSRAVINGCLAYGSTENDRGSGAMRTGIFFLPLPHAEARQVAAGLTEENLVVMNSGAQVSLDLRVPALNAQDIDAITASYTNQLKSFGVSVVAGAPLTFQATVEAGKTETRTYRSMGRPGTETVNVTTQMCRLALMENGKLLWERSAETSGAGFMVSYQKGETLQAAVDRASQESAVNFFRNSSLPGRLARQGEHGAYGFSRVTSMGLIAYDPAAEPAAPVRGRLRR
jgi:hypothetical protein